MFLLPIIAGYSAYNMATTRSNKYEASGGDRKINCYDIWEKIVTGPGTGSIAEGQAGMDQSFRAGDQQMADTAKSNQSAANFDGAKFRKA